MSTPDQMTREDVAPGAYVLGNSDPHRVALIGPDGREVTFGELGESANRLANAMRDAGLTAGDVVAVLLHNGIEFFEVLLATGQVGLYFVPINVHLAPAEVEYIVTDSSAKMLIAHHDLAASLHAVRAGLPGMLLTVGGPTEGWHGYAEFRSAASAAAPRDRVAGNLMGYTSGTTGRPRGVRRRLPPIEPEVLAAFYGTFMAAFDLRPGRGVHLVCSPLYHAAPLNSAHQLLHLGHTVVIRRKFDAEEVLGDIERFGVTSSQMVPTHLHRVLRLPEGVIGGHDLSSLTHLLVAGAPFGPEAKRAVIDLLGPVVWEYLAATEGIVAIVSPTDALAHPGTVGKPVVGVRIVDGEGNPVPTGESGTIYFAMQTPFDYLNDPGKTAAAVTADGYATAGDLGRLDEDGYLYLLDRRDDLIISGGVNIYPAEVEQRLILHPSVADVGVVGVSDPEWGQTVVALVQPEPGFDAGEALADELDRHCREALARQKCPRRYEFRATLPRTPTGKLLRRVLRESLGS